MRPYSTKVRSVGGTEMHTATPIRPPQARPAVNHSEKTTRNARSIASLMVHYARRPWSLCHHRSLPWLTTPHHVVYSAVTAASHPRDAHHSSSPWDFKYTHGVRFGDLAQGRFAVPNGGNETSSGRC
ncbi:hypothetical protein CSOJ01_12897 [Colletotrichum sojae]|uniref:Uncharacterized protein n=1 Tax=Colletotrichum sojae TaxID=2175907 RepID=A0A8H6ML88_9PEZI|nr:hypothetical protein CSOJ01_12897 [Colletotrichum sojae]